MRRLEEERDMLKRPRGTLPVSPSEVPLHERALPSVRNYHDVSYMRVARAGVYQWLHQPVSDREQENHRLLRLIRDAYAASRGV